MERPMRETNDYPDLNEWQVAGIQRAVASLDRERVKEWVKSWNGKKERPAPKTLGDMNIIWSPESSLFFGQSGAIH
jgi:hypothetical protein